MNEEVKRRLVRAEELEALLASPDILKDRQAVQKFAKELTEISKVVVKARALLRLEPRLAEAEGLVHSSAGDPELQALAKAEVEDLRRERDGLEEELERLVIPQDPDADRAVIVEIRAGTGGLEASLFAADLFRMYSKYAARKSLKVEVMSTSPSEAGGFKEIVFGIEGTGPYRYFKYESGVHRVQRVPATEASGRIHTSTATVAVLPQAEEVEVQINPQDLMIDVYRSSGHGGQSVNTTDSAVRITHKPSGLIVTCQDERSQLKNKAKAMKVLRARLLSLKRSTQAAEIAKDRRAQIGGAMRSEKIRTFNFPDHRVTDHRIGLTVHKIDDILEGDLDGFVEALAAWERDPGQEAQS